MLLTQEEQKQFATLLNALIDLPLVPEDLEQAIFEHAIVALDNILEDVLPVVFHELLRTAETGIDKDQAKDFTDRLVNSVNQKLDLPYLNEEQEAQLVRTVITPLVKGMTNGKKLSDFLPILQAPAAG